MTKVKCDCQYGPHPTYNLMDVYTPDDAYDKPIFIYFHGGGLYEGDKQQKYMRENGDYFIKNDVVFIGANYTLGPVPSETYNEQSIINARNAAHDMKLCIEYIYNNINLIGNKSKIVVGGGSAGAVALLFLLYNKIGIAYPHIEMGENFTIPIKGVVSNWGAFSGQDWTVIWETGGTGYNYFDASGKDYPILCIHGTEDTNLLTPFNSSIHICKAADYSGIWWDLKDYYCGHAAWTLYGDYFRADMLEFINNVVNNDPPINPSSSYTLPSGPP